MIIDLKCASVFLTGKPAYNNSFKTNIQKTIMSINIETILLKGKNPITTVGALKGKLMKLGLNNTEATGKVEEFLHAMPEQFSFKGKTKKIKDADRIVRLFVQEKEKPPPRKSPKQEGFRQVLHIPPAAVPHLIGKTHGNIWFEQTTLNVDVVFSLLIPGQVSISGKNEANVAKMVAWFNFLEIDISHLKPKKSWGVFFGRNGENLQKLTGGRFQIIASPEKPTIFLFGAGNLMKLEKDILRYFTTK